MPKAELQTKPDDSRDLLNQIRGLIEEARRQAAAAVNVGLTVLYWRIGDRILREVLGNERATYGEQIVATLSRQLVSEFGRGFADKNLRRMMQFADMLRGRGRSLAGELQQPVLMDETAKTCLCFLNPLHNCEHIPRIAKAGLASKRPARLLYVRR